MSSFQPQESAAPKLCAAGCSFFGNPATNGMCSVCYKKHRSVVVEGGSGAAAGSACAASVVTPIAAASAVAAAKPAAAPATSVSFPPAMGGGISETVVSSSSSAPEAATKAQPNRCPACYKKVGLTGFLCRCGKTFCGKHRYAEEHGCTFDFKGAGRDQIARANPLIMGEKLIGKI